MLLLFVISGMSARYELSRKETREFVRIRSRKYLVPSTIGLFVFGWILGYYNMKISGAQIMNTPIIVVYRFGIYGIGFFAGYYIFSHDKVMDRLEYLTYYIGCDKVYDRVL